MFIVVLFTTAKNWRQFKWLPTREWMKELQYSHQVEDYSAMKRNQLLIHAITCSKTLCKTYVLYKPIYMKCSKQENYRNTRSVAA